MRADDPRHGTYAGYHAHRTAGEQPCEPCMEGKRIYQRRANKRNALGYRFTVDPALTARHVNRLFAAGMRQEDIARAAKCDRMTINRLRCGKLARIHVATAARLLAVTPSERDHFRPAVGTVRRLQALVAIGHRQADLAARLGMHPPNFGALIHGERITVTTGTYTQVAELFEEMCMTPGGDRRALGVARKHGWLPPLMWDDIDDENEQPKVCKMERTRNEIDHAVVERILAGDTLPATRAERQEVMRRWIARGWPTNELERRTGWKVERYGRKGAA